MKPYFALIQKPKGLVLPIVICIMILLFIIFCYVSFLTRAQQRSAHFFFEGESALGLAESAGREIQVTLETISWPSSSRPDLLTLYQNLIHSPPGEEKKEYELRPGPETEILLSQYGKMSPLSVTVKVYLSRFRAIPFSSSSPGMKVDPLEKQGLIRIEVTSIFGKAKKKLNFLRQVKVVRITHPVFSKFSLFIKEAPSSQNWVKESNLLHQDYRSLNVDKHNYFLSESRHEATPIELNNGEVMDLAPHGEYDFQGNRGNGLSMTGRNAFIFLGGRWRIGLGEGTEGSRYSERFLSRLAKYDITHLLDDMGRDSLAQGRLQVAPSANIARVYLQLFGMNDDWLMGDRPVPLESSQALQFYRHPDDGTQVREMSGSFALRLFGTIRSFSPTIVLGDVERYYQRFITIDCRFHGMDFKNVTMPFLHNEVFELLLWPDRLPFAGITKATLQGAAAVFGLRPGDKNDIIFAWNYYPQYFMCTIITEHFMRALDFVFTNNETGPFNRLVEKNNGSDPVPENGITFQSLGSPSIGLEMTGGEPESRFLGKNVSVSDRSETLLFKGDLRDIDGYDELVVRSVRKFSSVSEFEKRCFQREKSNGREESTVIRNLTLPGVAILKTRDLIVSRPWLVKRGGVLITTGNITIKAPIKTLSGEVLTICAGGSIRIATSQPVQASLLAPKGTFTKDPSLSGFQILGTVMARKFDFENLVKGAGEKTIKFNRTFDFKIPPPSNEPFFPRRFYLSDEERVYFGK